jgi:hypothetical protein
VWNGFDPELRRRFESIREMVSLSHRTPTREWPLVYDEQHNQMLVVREWPNGSLTAYLAPHPVEDATGSDS